MGVILDVLVQLVLNDGVRFPAGENAYTALSINIIAPRITTYIPTIYGTETTTKYGLYHLYIIYILIMKKLYININRMKFKT